MLRFFIPPVRVWVICYCGTAVLNKKSRFKLFSEAGLSWTGSELLKMYDHYNYIISHIFILIYALILKLIAGSAQLLMNKLGLCMVPRNKDK